MAIIVVSKQQLNGAANVPDLLVKDVPYFLLKIRGCGCVCLRIVSM